MNGPDWRETIRRCFASTPEIAEYAIGVADRLGDPSAAPHAVQYVCAGLTRARVHEFATVQGEARRVVDELVTDKDRQVARVSPEALAYYPALLWAMWEELPRLSGFEYEGARDLLLAAMEAFARGEAA